MKRGMSNNDIEGAQQKQRRLVSECGDSQGSFYKLVTAAESQNPSGPKGTAEQTAQQINGNIQGEQKTHKAKTTLVSKEAKEVRGIPVSASIRTEPATEKQLKSTAAVLDAVSKGSSSDDDEAGVTHPNPKNFAERLMFALEKGIGADVIKWAGDGRAVAIHPKRLKKDTVLETHFRVKNYGAFIRNCNRWGFKRVNCYAIPDGQVTYECSLFRQDQPHLVKHMRMDSDVQDVFARHHVEEKGSAENVLGQPNFFDSKPAASPGVASGLPQQHQPIGMSVNFRQPQQPQPSQQLISSLMGQIAQNNQGTPNNGGQAQGTNAISTLLASLLQGQASNNNAQNAISDAERVMENLLAQILQKSGEYLKHPPMESPFDAAIRTVLQLLQNHAAKPQAAPSNQPQPFFSAPQQAQPPPSFPPATSMTNNENAENANSNDIISRLQAMLQGNNNQSQAQMPNADTASALHQLLAQQGTNMQGGQGTAAQTQDAPLQPPPPPPVQQQQQHPAPQQQQVPNIQDLMAMLMQQQRQGGN